MNSTPTEKGNKIISANYRDRNSSVKWLVRDESQKPEEAAEESAIIAQNVTFGSSDKYESGFGCSTVATAEFVQVVDSLPPSEVFVQLHFDGSSEFYTGAPVHR